jgi:hypothetical protein
MWRPKDPIEKYLETRMFSAASASASVVSALSF